MQAGRLRHWLTFEDLVSDLDSDGAQTEVWIASFGGINNRLPCDVEDLGGRELLAAQAIQPKVTTRIVTRWRPGFSARMRATSPAGTVYNVESVNLDPDSRIRMVTMLASSGVNLG